MAVPAVSPSSPTGRNRLAGAASPYLLAHAADPVDWQPWGEEAFAAARERRVPLLLSVGYAACHWCHVMHRESFGDAGTAQLINDWFVPVKVDREERPDIDRIYLDAVTALTGHAGWPLTAFLTPAGEPFFGGTYFPPEDRHGMPSFRAVLSAVHQAWEERREDIAVAAARLAARLSQPLPPGAGGPGDEILTRVYRSLEASFDPVRGGFGGPPKFPPAASLEFLLRVAGRPWAPRAAEMARRTLEAMADGGLHDQAEGGFARYAVDEGWVVPHFEKMLYDNALLARLYLRAAQVTAEARFTAVARSTLDYLLAALALPGGGFASSEDADSDGEEGLYYTLSADEFAAAAGSAAPLAGAVLGVTPDGVLEGRNVLHRARPAAAVAAEAGVSAAEVERAVAEALAGVRSLRSRRVRPERDDKTVAAWNGLAIRALAEAAAVLGEPRYLEAAESAGRFALVELRRADGRLLRARRAGAGEVPGFCDDYAALALGLFALFRASGDPAWFHAGAGLIDDMEDLFSDRDTGAFFATGGDAEALIARPANFSDHPTPSDNALAAEALLTLAAYTGEDRHRARALRALHAGAYLLEHAPAAVGHLAAVLAVAESPTAELAVVGPSGDPATQALLAVAEGAFRPDLFVARGDGTHDGGIPILAGRAPVGGRPAAYLCRRLVCQAPLTDPAALREALAEPPPLPGGGRRVAP